MQHNIITKMQSVYIKERSTTRTIYFALYEIVEAFNKNQKVATALSKAFHSVNHSIPTSSLITADEL